MISLLLLRKIAQMFLGLVLGFILVRSGKAKAADSKPISVVILFLINPCVIIGAYQVDFSGDMVNSLLLSFGAAIAIHLEDRGPVFYRQERVTLDGKSFNILKFRSMVVDAERYGAIPATENDPRITRVGRLLRKVRIDELPQLLNILAGHMSFVGPRPERVLHVALYEQQVPEFKYRLRVKGGLTGYAQVYGKYNTSPEDKLKLDMLYIENQSLLLDFKLVLLTIKILFSPESTEGFDKDRSDSIHRQDREGNEA